MLDVSNEGIKCASAHRFFGRVFLFFHLQRPPLCGWSAIAQQVALTYTASIIVALAAQQAGRPELIRSPKRVLSLFCQVGRAAWNKFMMPISSRKPARKPGMSNSSNQGRSRQ